MKKYLIAALALAFPAVAFGQQLTNISVLVASATHILNQLIPFFIGLGVVVFFYGIIRYALAGSGEDKSAARSIMIWGIIALFVMVSVWGLVNFLGNALGLNNAQNIPAPNIPTNASGGY
ncbi:MAG TPA: hypothetical protein VFA52_00880 [Candidatus Paceibacterota bacterium]|nr:hypothetical protein [Candidatus Paceibacterota bacterium]